MPLQTQELVSDIKKYYAPEWDRTAILEFIRRAQLELCLTDSWETIFWNPNDDTLPIPLLKTTAGQLKYEIGDDGAGGSGLLDSDGTAITIELTRNSVDYPVLIRKVQHVMKLREKWVGPINFGLSMYNRWVYNVVDDPRFMAVDFIPEDMNGTTNANITFLEDPETTTNTYYIFCHYAPIDLDSESVPMTIDGDRWRSAIIDGAVGMIEDIENGRSERLNKFEKYHKKRFVAWSASHTKSFISSSMRRREAG